MKFIVIFFSLCLLTMLNGGTVPFRSGEILAAEISRAKPSINNWNVNLFGMNSASSYAAVAVRIHPKRKISIYDYALAVNGVNHACVAIRTDGGTFEYTQKALSAEKGEIFTLLFFLKDVNVSDVRGSVSLVSLIPPTVNELVPLKITNRNGSTLCPFNAIRKDGNF